MKPRRTVYARQGAAKLHIVVDSAPGVGRCGAELHGDEYPARLVPADERCAAAPCRVKWPAPLRAVG